MRGRMSTGAAILVGIVCGTIVWFPLFGDRQTPILEAVTLVIHEGSHAIFMWAPQPLYILAGTLGQLLFPLSIVYLGWRKGSEWAIPLGLAWWSSSAWGAALYVADAPVQALPLLADGLIHDWHFLLVEHWNHPQWAEPIAGMLRWAGRLAALGGFALLTWMAVPVPDVERAEDDRYADTDLYPQGGPRDDLDDLPPEVRRILRETS